MSRHQLARGAQRMVTWFSNMTRIAREQFAIAPPEVYEILAELKLVPMPDLIDALAAGLDRGFDCMLLRQDDGGNPEEAVRTAMLYLNDAATAARAVREDLEAAQSAIARTSAQPR